MQPEASKRRLPTWMAEIAEPSRRANLWVGIWSGYTLAASFAILAYAAGETGVVPHQPIFYGLIAAKLFTNTIALVGLKRNAIVLETQTLNTLMDLITMTWAIHLTGGALSPLFGVYVILLAILALLTNVGVTIMTTVLAWAMHSTAVVLAYHGVIPAIPPPGSEGVLQSGSQVVVAIVFAALLLGVTGAFTSLLVRAHRRKTDRLEERTNELIRANTQRTLLLANITHELRTPIHGICGLADVLEAGVYGPVNDEQREAFGHMRTASGTLLQLIDDLLLLAKAEAGAIRLKLTEVDLDGLLQSVSGSVQWMIGTKELTLDVESVGDVPASITTDRGKLSQVLVNLLANAVKFTAEGGAIALKAQRLHDGVLFEVADTGMGIDDAQLKHIFEPFEQADNSDEREFGGAGLGLAIVQRLVRLISGTIEVESEVGKGTTFRVWVPMALDEDDTGQTLLDVTGQHRLAG